MDVKGNIRGQYLQMYSSDPLPQLFYDLAKVHKSDVQLRPIVSTVWSVTYPLAKHLACLLAPLVGNTSSDIKNGSFCKYIQSLDFDGENEIVSFDVTSLFTSVQSDVAYVL